MSSPSADGATAAAAAAPRAVLDEMMRQHQATLAAALAAAAADPASSARWHPTTRAALPAELHKYWRSRTALFSRYHDGIWMTGPAWFGATPEPVAAAIADHAAAVAPPHKRILVDAFAGTGGNAIAFAASGAWDRVYAIEADRDTIVCGMHNAEIYGVDDKITWIHSDCFAVLQSGILSLDPHETAIFASPPWGGISYLADDVFDISKMEPYSLDHIYTSLYPHCHYLVLYLPRTTDLHQLARFHPRALLESAQAEVARGVVVKRPEDMRLPIEHYCINGFSKALCVYYGATSEITEAEWPRSEYKPTCSN